MELFDPEQDVRHEETAHLGAAEIELVGSPIRVDLTFKEHVAVKRRKTFGVCAETARYPIKNDTDARLVAGVDEVHQLLWCAVA